MDSESEEGHVEMEGRHLTHWNRRVFLVRVVEGGIPDDEATSAGVQRGRHHDGNDDLHDQDKEKGRDTSPRRDH